LLLKLSSLVQIFLCLCEALFPWCDFEIFFIYFFYFEISKHVRKTRLLFCIFVKLWASVLVIWRWIFLICMHVFMRMTLLVLIMLSTYLITNETWPIEGSKPWRIFICKISPLKTKQGVYHTVAKEELWKLKYFTIQKYNLQKIL
jgi:hypothetical protein